MLIDKLINKSELANELGLKPGSIRKNNIHKKYQKQIQELNDLIEYWRKRHE